MMEQVLVVFASLSHMNWVKRSFRAEGRYLDGVRTPNCLSPGGCSYAIVCPAAEAPVVVRRACAANLPVRGLYRELKTGGEVQYFPLESTDTSAWTPSAI